MAVGFSVDNGVREKAGPVGDGGRRAYDDDGGGGGLYRGDICTLS